MFGLYSLGFCKNKIRDKMMQLCEKVGIPRTTPRDLRHAFASRPELSSKAKQEIGGWSSKQVMEKTYGNIRNYRGLGSDSLPRHFDSSPRHLK